MHQQQRLGFAIVQSEFLQSYGYHGPQAFVTELHIHHFVAFTRPNCIMTEVVIIFSIIFCPVPDFMRELPVTYSGPYNHFDGCICLLPLRVRVAGDTAGQYAVFACLVHGTNHVGVVPMQQYR